MPHERSARIGIGSRVLILTNPHHARTAGILSTVVDLRPEAGLAGTDLADVRYEDPVDSIAYVMPFSVESLSVGAQEFLAAAERHEAMARELRQLAERRGLD